MINTEDVLAKQVTFLDYVWDRELKRIQIIDFLNQIKNRNQEEKITQLRNYLKKNNKKKYDIEKTLLPSVAFSGLFNDRRTIETIQEYNTLCTIDIDHIPRADIQELLKKFYFDPYIISYWLSPSGNGIKGLVKFKYLTCLDKFNYNDYHRYAFSLLNKYMQIQYNIEIDKSGSDITRLCFISSDSNLIMKDKIEEFEIGDITISPTAISKKNRIKTSSYFIRKEHLYPVGRNKATKRNDIQRMLKFLKNKHLSITDNYEKWFRIAYAVSNTFTYDIGEKYFLQLCRLDGPRHDEGKSIDMLQYCYVNSKRSISFGTIKYYFDKSKEEWGRRTKGVSH
jgi:hypothetical protein